MTGTHWIEESGVLETPILITNTNSVGVVRDAAIAWMVQRKQPGDFWYPVVAETADWLLNDIKGQHITALDALEALNSAAGGPIQEGNVGGGTGMICKASRVAPEPPRAFWMRIAAASQWAYSCNVITDDHRS